MPRKQRQVERVPFNTTDLSAVLERMARLTLARDGWINLIPTIGDDDEMPTSLPFFTLLSGGGTGVTMCTWVPAKPDHHIPGRASLGITHVTGRRAAAALNSLGVPVPTTWFVEQDHPRRGLVVRVPEGEPNDRVLAWALRAVAGLTTSGRIRRWRAEVHLPSPA